MLSGALSLLGLLVVLILLVAIVLALAVHFGYRAPRTPGNHTPEHLGLAYQNVSLTTPAGNKLAGWFLPYAPQAPVMIILHGWGASSALMLPLAAPLYNSGFNILLIDARNHGRSDNEGHSSLPRFAEDLHQAIDYLQQHPGLHNGRIVLAGHSVGAGAVLYAASQRADIHAVISLSAFAHPDWVMRRQLSRFHLPGLIINTLLKYIQWVIGVPFDQIAPMNTACQLRCPVLLVHGDRDEMVPLSDAYAIRNNCADKRLPLLLIKGGRHNASNKIHHHIAEVLAFLDETGINRAHKPL